jgi:hypothetical protein
VNKSKKRGWFRGGDEGTGDVEADAANHPPLDESLATRPEEASIDTMAIFESAGIAAEDRERVERARALLKILPQTATPVVRKEIVETALKVFGVPTEKIVETAERENAALEAFIRANQDASDRLREDCRARVQAFEQEILRVKQAAEQATAVQERMIRLANAEMIAVQQVLGFFGLPGPESPTDIDLEEVEPTRDRSDMSWGVQLPVPPPKTLPRPGGTTPPKLPDGSKG